MKRSPHCLFFILFGLAFHLALFPLMAQEEETGILRERLVKDALERKGFVPRIQQYIEPVFGEGKDYQASLQEDGSWADVDYLDRDNEWDPLTALNRILVMAYDYAHPDKETYQDPSLLTGIQKALDYWYSVAPECDNWYKNRIAKQMYLAVIGLLVQEDIGKNLLEKVIHDLTDKPTMTGSNRTLLASSVLYRGVLENNPERIHAGVQGVMDQVTINEKEGIQPDYSFHQHGPYLYNGSYGSGFLRESIWTAAMVQGTSFAFPTEKIDLLRDYLIEGTRWMVRNGLLDYNVRGRQVGRPSGFGQGAQLLVPQLEYFILADPSQAALYQTSLDRIIVGQPQDLVGNRHFWRSDYTAHHRENYFVSLRMCSERTNGVETDVNAENLLGYYLPYGLTYLYRRGDEYVDVFPVWDWGRLPGVTSPEKVPVIKGNFTQQVGFVGGVSDGKYGVSAMELDKEQTTGRKSWFWFDDEFVALGAGIQSSHEHTVSTGINQCLLRGKVLMEGKELGGGRASRNAASWVWHDSVAYFFPESSTTLHLAAEERTGNLHRIFGLGPDTVYRKEVFALWFDHGTKPTKDTYAYTVLPGVDPEAAQQYSLNPAVQILSNTEGLQAVTHRDLGITGLVFYQSGGIDFPEGGRLEVNEPCLILVNHRTGNITVSDPTAQLKSLRLSVHRGKDKPNVWEVDLPQGLEAGNSVGVDGVIR